MKAFSKYFNIYIDAANILHAFMEHISDKISLNIEDMLWEFFVIL
jgi:hypothetical protein